MPSVELIESAPKKMWEKRHVCTDRAQQAIRLRSRLIAKLIYVADIINESGGSE